MITKETVPLLLKKLRLNTMNSCWQDVSKQAGKNVGVTLNT